MNHRDEIISSFADQGCKRISDISNFALQAMSDGMQSGDDTPLENLWDELCGQVQYRQSMFYDAYLGNHYHNHIK